MDSNALLDEVKKRFDLTSEYALSKKLNVTRQGLANIREKGLSDERALQIAVLLDLPVGEVMASVRAERATTPEVKAAWKKIAESMRAALGMAAMVAVAVSIAVPPKMAEASSRTVFETVQFNRSCTSPNSYLAILGTTFHRFALRPPYIRNTPAPSKGA